MNQCLTLRFCQQFQANRTKAPLTAVLSLPAEDMYMRFRKLYPGLEQRIAQKHIASYLGVTPVFLSMLRKRM